MLVRRPLFGPKIIFAATLIAGLFYGFPPSPQIAAFADMIGRALH